MPTKAELEAQLQDLKAELALNRQARETSAPDPEPAHTPPESDEDAHRQMGELIREFATTAENNPALALVGVFIAGLLVGRLSGR